MKVYANASLFCPFGDVFFMVHWLGHASMTSCRTFCHHSPTYYWGSLVLRTKAGFISVIIKIACKLVIDIIARQVVVLWFAMHK